MTGGDGAAAAVEIAAIEIAAVKSNPLETGFLSE
jgi:hypothetical protein